MNADPTAAMRCWAVDLEIGGQTYTIPPLPAADWWPLLADGDISLMIDMIAAGHDLDDRLLTGEVNTGDLVSAFLEGLESAAGRGTGEAMVIAHVAGAAWAWIGGRLALAGFRWDLMPLAAALDAVHGLLITETTDEFRAKYESALRQAAPERLDRERARAQAVSEFEAMAGPRPTGGLRRATGEMSAQTPARTRTPPQPPRPRAPSGAPTPQLG